LGSYTGLTPSYGFNFTGEKTVLNFTGTQAAVNAALATLQVSTGAEQGAFAFDVTSSINGANTYYNPVTNSYYQYFADRNVRWAVARAAAKTKTLNGATGYLVNITTDQENEFVKSYVAESDIWIGASDEGVEGVWLWMDGPEGGTQFWQGNTPAKGGYATGPFNYAAWAVNQPDDSGNAEDWGSTNFRGTRGAWNDLPVSGAGLIRGYLVEYTEPVGGWTPSSVSQQTVDAAIGSADGGIGGAGGAGGLGGNGALGGTVGGTVGGTASAGGAGGVGGVGGQGGTGGGGGTGNGGTGGPGGTGGDGGTSGTSNAGTAGSNGTAGSDGVGTTGGAGGNGGSGGTGGTV
jgi:hypothetical protein